MNNKKKIPTESPASEELRKKAVELIAELKKQGIDAASLDAELEASAKKPDESKPKEEEAVHDSVDGFSKVRKTSFDVPLEKKGKLSEQFFAEFQALVRKYLKLNKDLGLKDMLGIVGCISIASEKAAHGNSFIRLTDCEIDEALGAIGGFKSGVVEVMMDVIKKIIN